MGDGGESISPRRRSDGADASPTRSAITSEIRSRPSNATTVGMAPCACTFAATVTAMRVTNGHVRDETPMVECEPALQYLVILKQTSSNVRYSRCKGKMVQTPSG
jgi:hypothetical protein